MSDIANFAKSLGGNLEEVGDFIQVLGRELPNGLVGIWIDDDAELDLALKLLEAGGVLCLGFGKVVRCDIVDSELMLLKDVLAFGSVAKIIVADEDTARVVGDSVEEACVLQRMLIRLMETGRRTSHKLHLVLNAEKFVLRVESSMSTVRKPGDELISGNIAIVVFG